MGTTVRDFYVNYHFYMLFRNMYKYNPYNLIVTFRASFWSRTRLLGFSVRPNHRVWVSWQNDCPRIVKEFNLPLDRLRNLPNAVMTTLRQSN